jgi:hypothetical protein
LAFQAEWIEQGSGVVPHVAILIEAVGAGLSQRIAAQPDAEFRVVGSVQREMKAARAVVVVTGV